MENKSKYLEYIYPEYKEKVDQQIFGFFNYLLQDEDDFVDDKKALAEELEKPHNQDYITKIGVSNLIKKHYPAQLEKLQSTIQKIVSLLLKRNKFANEYQGIISTSNKVYIEDAIKNEEELDKNKKMYKILKYEFLESILSLGIVDKMNSESETMQPSEFIQTVMENIKMVVNTKELSPEELQEFRNKIIKCFNAVTQDFSGVHFNINSLRREITTHIITYYANGNITREFALSIGHDLGVMDNASLLEVVEEIENLVMSAEKNSNGTKKVKKHSDQDEIAKEFIKETFRDLLDMSLILDKLEDGTISKKEKRFVTKEDCIRRFLDRRKNNQQANKILLEKMTVRDLVFIFERGDITFEELYIFITETSIGKTDKDYSKRFFKQKITSKIPDDRFVLSSEKIFELVSQGLVDPKDVIKNYMLYPEELKRIFNVEQLVDTYFNIDILNANKKQEDKANELIKFFEIHKICLSYMTPEEIGKAILEDKRTTPNDISILASQVLTGVYYEPRFAELYAKLLNNEWNRIHVTYPKTEAEKQKMQEQRDSIINNAFLFFNKAVFQEEDLATIFEDDYEQVLAIALGDFGISPNKLNELAFLDHDFIMHTYYKGAEQELPDERRLDFDDIVTIYLTQNQLIQIEDVQEVFRSEKQHILDEFMKSQEGFENEEELNISSKLYNIIKYTTDRYKEGNVELDISSQIRELYMAGYLVFDELSKMVEDGIISSEEANSINKDFSSQALLDKLKNVELGVSQEAEEGSSGRKRNGKYTRTSYSEEDSKKYPTADSLETQQMKKMLEVWEAYGFKPLTTPTNAFGYSEIQTFKSGNFEGYMILLSDEIPEVSVLMHCGHVPSSDIYYQVGGNATYILSSSALIRFLEQSGAIKGDLSNLGVTKQSIRVDNPYLRTANICRGYGKNIGNKIYEILHMLDDTPELEEYTPEKKQSKNKDKLSDLLPMNLSDEEKQERLEMLEILCKELAQTIKPEKEDKE